MAEVATPAPPLASRGLGAAGWVAFFLAVFFVPLFFVVVRGLFKGSKRPPEDGAADDDPHPTTPPALAKEPA